VGYTQMSQARALGQDPLKASARKLPPLFKVGVLLQNTEVIIQPPVNEVRVRARKSACRAVQ